MRSRYKITEVLKEEVKEQLRKEKSGVVKERLIALNMYISGMKQEDVAISLGRHRGFVARAVNNYFRIGIAGLQEQRGGDRRSKLSTEEKEELGYIVKNSCPINSKGWDGKIIVDLVEHKYKIKYSRNTIYRILKELNISYKKAKKVDPKKSELKIEVWKEDIKKT